MASTDRKRRYEDAHSPDGPSVKRTRRSRWGSDDDAAPQEEPAPSPSANGALSEIVKRLSSVVKEKSASMTPPAAAPVPNGSPTDGATARARAVAQASLLAMGLPVGQTSTSDLAKRVYVGNLYYDLKEDDIRSFFGPFGAIRSVDLSMEPGMARSKGFCFIEYGDVLAAESAVQVLNGAQLSNRTLKVGRPHRGNSGDPTSAQNIGKEATKNVPTKCIYVGGVRVELNSAHLQSIFSPFGDIRACVMPAVTPLESSQHRGFGFIEYADETAATTAIQHMNGFELAGQKLKVGKASPATIRLNHTPSPSSENNRRCLCLLNMVQKGDVDAELADEVRGECSRFGAVERVAVHEVDDHVRVFVVFRSPDDALNAQRAMHGRFFGGHQVRAAFYALAELQQERYDGALRP